MLQFVSGRDLREAVRSPGTGTAPKLGSLILIELSEDTFSTYSSPSLFFQQLKVLRREMSSGELCPP